MEDVKIEFIDPKVEASTGSGGTPSPTGPSPDVGKTLEVPSDAGGAEPVDTSKGDFVPRSRLNEVIQERNTLREQVTERDALQQRLEGIYNFLEAAKSNPSLLKEIGIDTVTSRPDDTRDGNLLEDPVVAIKKELSDVKKMIEDTKRERQIERLQGIVETEKAKYPLFTDPNLGPTAEELLAARIGASPGKPLPDIVRSVVSMFEKISPQVINKFIEDKTKAISGLPPHISGGEPPVIRVKNPHNVREAREAYLEYQRQRRQFKSQ